MRCLRALGVEPGFLVGGDNEEDEVRERVRGGRAMGGRVRSRDSDEVEMDVDVVDRDREERNVVLRALYPVVRSFLSSVDGES